MWDAIKDPVEIAKRSANVEWSLDNYAPQSSVAHLQVLFAGMEFGLEKYCDPEEFCKSLRIDVELQQDAQVRFSLKLRLPSIYLMLLLNFLY